MKSLILVLIVIILMFPVQRLFSQIEYTIEELLQMSLDDLMKLKVRSGTLIDIEKWEMPVALTTINREDIELTPARNILDLLEIYVPGFTYVEHFMGPRLGLRGLLSDQNYSFLLLVNGKNSNLKFDHGMFFEITNKDLSEIQRIEIIRGPGSVTYGPGAIAGIINIITINDHTNKVNNAVFSKNLLYNFSKYSFESHYMSDKYSSSLYFSQTASEGNDQTRFWYVDRAHGFGYGFMSNSWGGMDKGTLPPVMYADYRDKPERKLQYHAIFLDDYELTARYTSMTQSFTTQSKSLFDKDMWDGFLGRQAAIELKYSHRFSDQLSYKTALSYDSADICEYGYSQANTTPPDHISHKKLSFSENEYSYDILVNYKPSKNLDLAIGSEYTYKYYAPQWGMEDRDFVMALQPPIGYAVLDTISGFYQYHQENTNTTVTSIDEDIDSHTFSFFAESYMVILPQLRLMLSGRYDNHSLAEPAFSPRLALISPINDNNVLKLTIQQSVRLPVFKQLYSQNYLGTGNSEFEKLRGIELSYQRMQTQNLTLGINAYYNEIDQFSWIPEDSASGLAGHLDLMGIEAELLYKTDKRQLGINYSFIKQLNWESAFNDTAWISGLDGEIIYLEDNASDRMNNLPSHYLKIYCNRNLTDDLRLHIDGRFAFDYQQAIMLDKFEDAQEEYGNPETIAEMENIISSLEDHGYAQPSFTSDLSLSWKNKLEGIDFTTTIFARNLVSYNNVRYVIQYWEIGNLYQYPRQCGFIEEPINIGLEVSCNF